MTTPQHAADRFAAIAEEAKLETGPIEMINMIRFRGRAEYSDGEAPDGAVPTGAEAYATYGALAGPFVAATGGRRSWASSRSTVVFGPADEEWDAVFAVRYPNRAAFIALVTDPGYQAIAHHRAAAVADSRLVMIELVDG